MSRLAVVLVVLAALAGLGAWLFYFVGTDTPRPADVIVVLSGNPGRPSTGLRLQREGVAPMLALSLAPETERKLAPVCRRRSVDCFHASAYSTQGEARTFARLAREHGWRSAVIVSSRYHLRRAKMLFDRCTPAKLQVSPARTTLLDYLRNTPFEIGKLFVQLTFERGC